MFWSTSLSDVKKGVKNDIIMTSLAYYGVKNALFDKLNHYTIANNDLIEEKIGWEVSLIEFFMIHLLNSDLHESSELQMLRILIFGQKMVSKNWFIAKNL